MYVDNELSFNLVSNNVITAQDETTASSYISDQVVDLGHIPRNVIDNLYCVFQVEVALVSATGTITIALVTSAAAALTTAQTLWSSGLVANATMVAWTAQSTVYAFRVPANMLLRYLGMTYVIGTAALTAGSWRAFLTPDAPYHIAATP